MSEEKSSTTGADKMPQKTRRFGEDDANIVIETKNLSKVYRDFWGRQKVRALKALDLEVQKGEIFGLLGPNGSGKSTTMKLLLGLLFPSGGQALVLGKEASNVEKNERIGYLPEESYLYKFLNAEETLDFYGRLFDMPAKVRRDRVKELIEKVGLTWARRRQLKEYSKGMTRRIGLAQALINDPDLILLDEPTSGLDPIGVDEMKSMIMELKEQGKTVVMCSHLLTDVQNVCDRIAILHQGELKELGRVDSLLEVSDEIQFRASGLSADAEKEIQEVIERHNGKLLESGKPSTTLQDLFLEIVSESEARPGRRVTRKD
jgi:ABC-2 type transport system ATP-binding protein